ncbi:helix-turn-helix domain-containing protein [Pseudonocardia sp.]|uniref:helix-turn-helix domain-containing protein n=1 Tax=Pseudonocardia sp. TaxID=60912 RepID=UPI00260A2861|nr:helix-turn-helix domain-containing protein [Pseudonocardia sp.]
MPDLLLSAGAGSWPFGEVTAMIRAITGARSRAEVLDALCSRIRYSLGTSTAYVAVNRAGGREAVVSSSHGLVTPLFRTLRLPHCIGLGGLVASDGVARSTEDYAGDATFRHSPALDRSVRQEGLRGIAAAPVVVGGNVIGAAMAAERDRRRFGPQEMALLEALCAVAAAAIGHHTELRAAERRVREADGCAEGLREVVRRQRELLTATALDAQARQREELCADLVAGRVDEPAYRMRAVVLGLDPAQRYDVHAIAPQAGPTAARVGAPTTRQHVAMSSRPGEDVVVALVPVGEPTGAHEIAARLGLGARATVGVAGPAAGAIALHDAGRQAMRTLRLLRGLGRDGAVADAGSPGPLGLLAAGAEPGQIRAVLDAVLAPLADLDEDRRTRHLATLVAWFDQDGSVKRTARALGVHVNTVYGRLAGLDELFGPGWRGGRHRLELETSVRLQVLGTDLGRTVSSTPPSR